MQHISHVTTHLPSGVNHLLGVTYIFFLLSTFIGPLIFAKIYRTCHKIKRSPNINMFFFQHQTSQKFKPTKIRGFHDISLESFHLSIELQESTWISRIPTQMQSPVQRRALPPAPAESSFGLVSCFFWAFLGTSSMLCSWRT